MTKKIPEIDLVMSSTPIGKRPIRKLKREDLVCEVVESDWYVWMCGVNDLDSGFYPGTKKINKVTGEQYGIVPTNPKDPVDDWNWVGYHITADGDVEDMDAEEAEEIIWNNN